MAVVQLNYFLYKLLVAGVQVQVGAIDVHPRHVLSVVASLEGEVLEDVVFLVVEVVGNRLHPGVVRVARVIHVAAVQLEETATGQRCPAPGLLFTDTYLGSILE